MTLPPSPITRALVSPSGDDPASGQGISRAGRTYGPYRVIDEIGRGGMGVVYRAEDTRLGRIAALKFLPHSMQADRQGRERLMQEARAASRLDDPNICTIFGFEDTPDGETFIAMAYYGGETLAQRIERGAIPLMEGLDISVRITRGLAAAHRHGLTHRDLTPRNVMLPSHDTVKILDFGLAEAAGQETGQPVGTPSYMPPEQLKGSPASLAGDVWSLGVTLYEIFTGRRPFDGPDLAATLEAVRSSEPQPLRGRNPKVPEPLERLIHRLLRKEPAERPADATEVLAALEPIVKRQRGRTVRLATAGAFTGLSALTIVLLATRGPAKPPGSVPAARVVLLPIASDTSRREAVYSALGLHEAIASQLSQMRGIALISWTTGLPDENTPKVRRRLGRALSAVAIIEGEIGRDEKVTLRMHDAHNDRLLWSAESDFSHGVPEGIARLFSLQIAGALGVTAAPLDSAVQTPGTFATDPRTGHVYEAVPVTISWYDALEAAAKRHHQGLTGHLATITSAEEDEFVQHNLPEAVARQYWLGGFRAVRAGTVLGGWQWVTGEPWNYTRWSRKEPNDYFGEDGLQYWGAPPDSGYWNDIDRISGFEPFVGGFLVEYDVRR